MNFRKPTETYVKDKEYIEKLINVNLRKDLHDNEVICPHCHGTGLVIFDNRYGLTDDPDKSIKNMFPYKHQSITFCAYCYSGVAHRCNLCGKLIQKGRLKHDCEAQRLIDETERIKKWNEKVAALPEATEDMIQESFCLYSEEYSNNEGYFMDWDEFFEDWWYSGKDLYEDGRPEFAFLTEEIKPQADAYDIVSLIMEDMYENAMDDINDEKFSEFQNYLDNWLKTCGVGSTYVPVYKYKVRIPWELYDDEQYKNPY